MKKTLTHFLAWGGFSLLAFVVASLAGLSIAATAWCFVVIGILGVPAFFWLKRGAEVTDGKAVPAGRHFAE